jgi:NDP-sugar pyrophosphorylase family protein
LQATAQRHQSKFIKSKKDLLAIQHPWDLFQKNEQAIALDYHLLTKGRKSAKPDNSNRIIGKNIFIEKGAKLKFATINAETGPVYIGKDAEIMEGAIIRGHLH